MKAVGAALGHQLNLPTAAATFGRVGVGRYSSKLLDRIDGGIADRSRKLPCRLIVGVDSIDRDVSLVSARTRDRPGAVAASGTDQKSTRLNSSHGYISYAVFCL